MEGIEYENGRECWVGQSDEELAHHACRLLADPGERQQVRAAARALIEEQYSSQPVVDKMISVYRELTSTRETTRSPLCI